MPSKTWYRSFQFENFENWGGSQFFRNVWIKSSPQTISKIPRINLLFTMKFVLFWCKYANLDVCPGGSAAIKMFSISKMPEFNQMRDQHLSKISEIQNCLNCPMGERGERSLIKVKKQVDFEIHFRWFKAFLDHVFFSIKGGGWLGPDP